MRYKAAIFDLDGTLVKTEREYYITVMTNVINDLSLPIVSDALIDEFWRSMDKIALAQKYFNVPLETIWDTLRKYEDLDLRKRMTTAYGDVDYLEKLKNSGMMVGMVTGASERIANFEISLLPVTFDTVILARPTYGVKMKPDPEGLHIALKNLGVLIDEAFYVGNATEDILAAKAAGILDIAIDRGTEKVEAEPTKWINSLYDLEGIILTT